MKIHYPKNLDKKWQKFWEKEKIYKFNPKSKRRVFSIDTPPPYVSAEKLHMGHVMSYSQADFIARFWRQKGFNVFYPLGFDDNGLPTERYVEKKYNIDKLKIAKAEFVKLCLKETKIISKTYKALWQKMGLSFDWELLYNTQGKLAQRISQRSFIDLSKKGRIERRKGPVIWCVNCQTALSQADLQDSKEKSELVYIAFEIEGGGKITIATTRPELLPACVAIFVHPQDERYKNLVGKEVGLPFFNRKVKIYANESVDMKFGTGAVYHCTFGDLDDVEWVYKFGLPIIAILNKDGTLNQKAGSYKGLSIKEMREKIIADLEKESRIVKKEIIEHAVNIHERCKTPVEILVSSQWFIKLLDIKKEMLKQGEKLKWHPKFMKGKYDDWVKGLKWDWCISRQRYFGVPFPVWYCSSCGQVILAKDKDLPVDPSSERQGKKKCPKCGKPELVGEKDVMDTWMTSSLTPLINAKWGEKDELLKKIYPLNLRPQGFEIIRTWLFYTVVKSFFHTNSLPWKNVFISGWGLDPAGKKMSKSLGNVIEPEQVLKKYPSADAVRYWAAGANLGSNLRYQEKEVAKGHRLMTKLWNAVRFSFPYLKDYNPGDKKKIVLCPADIWILSKLQTAIKNCSAFFENYEYSRAKKEIEDFFWKDFCDNYLELVKYRLYRKNKKQKESALSALYKTILTILKLFAPILPYITEEIYQLLFAKKENVKSVHLSSWPKLKRGLINKKIEAGGEIIVGLIAAVRKSKSEKGYSLKTGVKKLNIFAPAPLLKKIFPFLTDLKEVNNIGVIEFKKEPAPAESLAVRENLKIKIEF